MSGSIGSRTMRGPARPMSDHPIPPAVGAFLAEHIDSVSLLEALLLVRAIPERTWTADEVARVRVTSETLATAQLDHLRRHGLLRRHDGGYRYAPADEHTATVDALAD